MGLLSGPVKTVPFSAFAEGRAEEVFSEVRHSGPRTVMNKGRAECVIVSPDFYDMLTADRDDVKLWAIAEDRLKNFDRSKLIPAEEVYREFGITSADIAGWEDVELE